MASASDSSVTGSEEASPAGHAEDMTSTTQPTRIHLERRNKFLTLFFLV
jgi:hypothetical protein